VYKKKRVVVLILAMSLSLIGCQAEQQGNKYGFDITNVPVEKVQISSCAAGDSLEVEPYGVVTETQITRLFQKYVTELDLGSLSGQFKYLPLFVSKADKESLCKIIQSIGASNPETMNRSEQMAFYINAYNVFTVSLIIEKYIETEVQQSNGSFEKSIRNIPNDEGLPLDAAVWDTFSWEINGQFLTLNQIEKDILVPMGDARIHFAVNCASKGCPPLRSEAFTAGELDSQLDEMSAFFVNNEFYSLYDYIEEEQFGEMEISQIFEWYSEDFENHQGGQFNSVRSFIVHYLDQEAIEFDKREILDPNKWEIFFYNYDWTLNEKDLL
tara:strand:- start:2249 stop:3226 length:978 start_codon:yes stop_codon:yes gene_type:complete